MVISLAAVAGGLCTAYLMGSFPTSFILAKVLKGVDIRQTGSKNAGATNVLRSVGKLPALITLIVDILKGLLAVTVVTKIFYSFGIDLIYEFFQGLMGLTVVCGHIWSVFLRFKGGKGVATTIGVGLALAPAALVPAIIIWATVFSLTGYVSLASITALMAYPLAASLLGYPLYTVFFGIAICCISIFKHKENIHRLLKGQESRTSLLKKKG